MSEPAPRLLRAGPAALYLELGTEPSAATSSRVAALARALAPWPEGVRDVVPGYTTLLVEHDPAADQAALEGWLRGCMEAAPSEALDRHHDVNVHYGLDADQEELSERLGLSWDDIVRLHQGVRYTVAFTGFTPGFPYLLGLPEALWLPRRDTPRPRVPSGAVAMAGAHAGIYPSQSPGGWWVVGRSDATLFSPRADPPTLLAAGDTLNFRSVTRLETPTPAPGLQPPEAAPLAAVLRAWPGSAALQGGPRWGVGHFGMAQAGALDPLALEVANALVGNPPGALAVEVVQALELLFEAPALLAVAGGGFGLALDGRPSPTWQAVAVRAGSRLTLVPSRYASGATAYLALRGGVAGAVYRDSASTDLRAGVGGLGRALQPGDALGSAGLPAGSPRAHPGRPRYPERLRLRVYPGPQYERAAFAQLIGQGFRIAALSRMGARLSGPRVALSAHEVASEGAPWGAVQVPPDAQPIILLADRGRSGGYAKPAVVSVSDLWQLAQARPGTEVHFEAATLAP